VSISPEVQFVQAAQSLVRPNIDYKTAKMAMQKILDYWENVQQGFGILKLDDEGNIIKFADKHPDWLKKMCNDGLTSRHESMYIDVLFLDEDSEFELVSEDLDGTWISNYKEPEDEEARLMAEFKRKHDIVTNEHCNIRKLMEMSKDPDMRYYVARHPNCPDELLLKLTKDKDIEVVKSALENPYCTAELLTKFSKHKDSSVRATVASHVYCPDDVLEKLSKDLSQIVRQAVGSNENCPADIKNKLKK
jgi:hypothetical protein